MNLYENILKLEEKYRTSSEKEHVLVFYFYKDNSKALKLLKKELPALKITKINGTETAFVSVLTNSYFITKFKNFIAKIQSEIIQDNKILKPLTFNTLNSIYQEYHFEFDISHSQQHLREVSELIKEEEYIPSNISSTDFISQLKELINLTVANVFNKEHSTLHKNPTFKIDNSTKDISVVINRAVDSYFKLAEDKIYHGYAQSPILFNNPLIDDSMEIVPIFKGNFNSTIKYFLQFNIDVEPDFFNKEHTKPDDDNLIIEKIKNLHPILQREGKDLDYELSSISLHDNVSNFNTFTLILSGFIGDCIKEFVSNENCYNFIQHSKKHNTLIHFDPTDYLRFFPGHLTMPAMLIKAKELLNNNNSHELNLVLNNLFEEDPEHDANILSIESIDDDEDDILLDLPNDEISENSKHLKSNPSTDSGFSDGLHEDDYDDELPILKK